MDHTKEFEYPRLRIAAEEAAPHARSMMKLVLLHCFTINSHALPRRSDKIKSLPLVSLFRSLCRGRIPGMYRYVTRCRL